MTLSRLEITNGTQKVNLLEYGFKLQGWNPQITEYKNGGVFLESPFTDGRRLVHRAFTTVTETYDSDLKQSDMNGVVGLLQDLRNLFEQAADFWINPFEYSPVWIVAQAACENNPRYAFIIKGSIPEENNPYSPPFFNDNDSVMTQLLINIERNHWEGSEPGSSEETQISGYTPTPELFSLRFQSNVDALFVSASATLNDLPTSSFWIEGWVYPVNWGGTGTDGPFYNKIGGGAGWEVKWIYPVGLEINLTDGSGVQRTRIDDFLPDSDWHHLLIYFEVVSGTGTIYVWVDGIESSYNRQDSYNSASYATDAANPLRMGYDASLNYLTGRLGWTRIVQGTRSKVDFTPLDLCDPPSIGDNTNLQFNFPSISGTITDESGNGNNGSAVGIDQFTRQCWGNSSLGTETGTRVHVSNQNTVNKISHLYRENGGVFSGNLITGIEAFPYDLFADVAGPQGTLYIGMEKTVASVAGYRDFAPFNNVVLNLDDTQASKSTAVFNGVWEYWDGAVWSSLTIMDESENFFVGDRVMISFEQPEAWRETTVNTIQGWWIRFRITTTSGAVVPTQKDEQPFTVNWAFVEIDEDEVSGDLPAIIKINIRNQSNNLSGSLDTYSNKVLAGVRSLSRGKNFTPFFYASEYDPDDSVPAFSVSTQMPREIYCTLGSSVTETTNRGLYVNGHEIAYTVSAEEEKTLITWTLSPGISEEYKGIYRVIAVVRHVGLDQGDISWRYTYNDGSGADISSAWKPSLVTSGTFEPIDLGRLEIGALEFGDERAFTTTISLDLKSTGATGLPGSVYFHYLVLFPVDEWAGEFIDRRLQENQSGIGYYSEGTYLTHLEIDSITDRKQMIRSLVKSRNRRINAWVPISSQPAIIQSGSDQRIWFFQTRVDSSGNERAESWINSRIELSRVQRYFSMRGDQ